MKIPKVYIVMIVSNGFGSTMIHGVFAKRSDAVYHKKGILKERHEENNRTSGLLKRTKGFIDRSVRVITWEVR